MNKQDLKSLLENIYHLLAEQDEWHPPMLAPDEWHPPLLEPRPLWWVGPWPPGSDDTTVRPPPPVVPPKPVYPPWPTDPEDERSRLRYLMIDDYDGWLEDMERDPEWWRDRYGFDVLEWWRSLNPGPEYRPGGMSG